METIIVIIIIAILTAIGAPIYVYRIERTKGEKTIANIELIKDALRMHYIKDVAEPDYANTTPLSNINNQFGLELTDSYFDYNISNQTTYRRIGATRNSGIYSSYWIRYNINPTNGNPDTWEPASDASKWPWHP